MADANPDESGAGERRESKKKEKSSTGTPKGEDNAPKTTQTRSGSSGGKKQKKSSRGGHGSALQAAKRKGRERNGQGSKDVAVHVAGWVPDSPPPQHKGTGLVYDGSLKRHYCPFDSEHGSSECPERLSACLEKLQERGLLDRCVAVTTREVTNEEILSLHSQEYLDTLESIKSLPSDDLKKLAESFDSVFLCNESLELARKSAGGILNIVDKVVKGELTNGFAVVRPPGHHAQRNIANGYSLLNNVALAAKIARTKWNVERVLIVDWDVHHGQGIQYLFEDDPSMLYLSMHRYENMSFWPYLKESNHDHTGKGAGRGYNVNVPWNQTGMGDAEYMAVFRHVLLPIAYEFNPELVLVCAGFDSASGDPKGEMAVSVGCFSHLTQQLMGLANGKVVLCLEGGYNLQTLGESVALCTETLLGDPCPPLPPLQGLCDSALETLTNVIGSLMPHWKSLRCDFKPSKDEEEEPIQSGDVSSTTPEAPHPQGGGDVSDPVTDVDALSDRLLKELMLSRPTHRTGLVYDERMKLHRTFNHPERPERIARIFTKHQEHGLVERCFQIQARQATDEELATCHLPDLIADIRKTSEHSARELIDMQDKFNTIQYSRDVYIHPDTYLCAVLAAGCCLNLVDAVLTNKVLNAVGIVRPPGHHADCSKVAGFCIFNNVALAAKYAQTKYGAKRILIVDWDVHHGNGTQAIFEKDPSVMYISVHRHDDGAFYPAGPEGRADRVGKGAGRGYNINIAWNTGNRGGMGDADYLAAFHRIIMPLAYQFNPELVFVSAGFDAAKGDHLGGCEVSPEGYGHMTHMLSSLAGGRVITVLEGGYNLHSIAVSMAMCTQVMLGDSCPDLAPGIPSCIGMQAIYTTAVAHMNFWSSMKMQVGLLETMLTKEKATKESDASPSDSSTSSSLGVMEKSVPEREEEVSSTQGVVTVDTRRGGDEEAGDSKDEMKSLVEGMSQMSVEKQAPHTGGGDGMASAGAADPEGVDVNEDAALGACGLADPEPGQGPKVKDVVGHLKETFGSEVQMHAVIPQPWCPHLEPFVEPLPGEGLDVSMPCGTCGDLKENWVCLHCYQVFCGRYVNEHMLMHGLDSGHLMVLSYSDLSVWCYGCDAYIHNEVLIPAKRAAHRSKFGEDIPGM